MTEKDIDLLTRFTNHIESALELIKMIKDFEPTHDVEIEIEILSRVQKILPNVLQEFIDFQDNIVEVGTSAELNELLKGE
ncbi:hypothetical protein [Dialister micraerophilus]|uniref:Uncharacterized protein n=1 Tax=Dialister micraerophilus UPII 345-E TaxID=910314 RepID=E4L8B9_9FIRM|nr:hypothetical protein [Dialister micraerophilus]EFR43007.1 hypothetical protein HMPREF9220_1102 [Dialister micraerophilus UPII 345-E]